MANLDVALILRLVDRATGPMKKATETVRGFGAALRDANLDGLMEASNRRVNAYRAEAVEVAALGYAFFRAAKPAIQFESAMADVRKVIDFDSEEGIGGLAQDIRGLSTEIPVALREIAAAVAAAGQANLVDAALGDDQKRAELIDFARDVSRTAVAFEVSADIAGKSIAQLRNIFGQTQPEVRTLLDVIRVRTH